LQRRRSSRKRKDGRKTRSLEEEVWEEDNN
jgi:hypothetical protein